jgi:DNA-binding CsgD family transcriptional regulator
MRTKSHADMTSSNNDINPAYFRDQITRLHAEAASIASPKKYEAWIDGPLKGLLKQTGSLSILCRRHSGGISVMHSYATGVGDIARAIACGPFSSLNCPYAEKWLDCREVLCMGRPFPNALSHEQWILELSASSALPGFMSGSIDNPSKSCFFFYVFGVPAPATVDLRQFKELFRCTTDAAHSAFLEAEKGRQELQSNSLDIPNKFMAEINSVLVLSQAERDIANLVCQGLSTKEIARALNKSPNTVSQQLHSVFKRNKIRTRTELAVRCSVTTLGSGSTLRPQTSRIRILADAQ